MCFCFILKDHAREAANEGARRAIFDWLSTRPPRAAKMNSAELHQALKDRGLDVKLEWVEEYLATYGKSFSVDTVWKYILQEDIREYVTDSSFPQDMLGAQCISGKHVVQVISVNNIAQPTSKRTFHGIFPKLLQVRIADGARKFSALEYENVSKLR